MDEIDKAVDEMRKALRALALEAPQPIDVASKFQAVVDAYDRYLEDQRYEALGEDR
jgi:hypothetical protein